MQKTFSLLIFSLIIAGLQVSSAQVTTSPIQKAQMMGTVSHKGSYPFETRLQHKGKIHSHEVKADTDTEFIPQKSRVVEIDGSFKKQATIPNVLNGFEGNSGDGGTPPDNTIAVSNGGIIVSAINSNMYYYNQDGSFLGQATFVRLVRTNFTDYRGILYDPRLIYDREADRFILTFLHGSKSAESRILLFFSISNNPVDGWYAYDLPGNALDKNQWTDYPNMSINDNDVFISGNLFNDNDESEETFIYQIDKEKGYAGATLDYLTHSGFKDANDRNCFTLVPAVHAKGFLSYNQMHFVSANQNSGRYLAIQTFSGSVAGKDVKISEKNVLVDNYSRALESSQKGVSDLLMPGDARIQTVLLLNNHLYVAHTTRIWNGNGAIAFYKIHKDNFDVDQVLLSESSFTLAYPAIGAPAFEKEDNSIILAYGRANSNIFPEVRMVHINENLDISQSVLIQEGFGGVDILSESNERWGDYFTIAKQHNTNTLWFFGSVGNENNRWHNYVAQVSTDKTASIEEDSRNPVNPQVEAYPNPSVQKVNISFDIEKAERIDIKLYSLSGELVEYLFNDAPKPGKKLFSFNVDHLPAGSYLIQIKGDKGHLNLSKKIVVSH